GSNDLWTPLSVRLGFLLVLLRGGSIVNAVIASIGLLMLLIQCAILVWGAEPLSYPERFAGGIIQLGSIILPSQSVWIAVLGLGVMIALQLFLRYTTPGIALRAVADDRLMGELGASTPTGLPCTPSSSAAPWPAPAACSWGPSTTPPTRWGSSASRALRRPSSAAWAACPARCWGARCWAWRNLSGPFTSAPPTGKWWPTAS